MRAVTYALMLSAPAAIAVTNPDVFLPATNFAGAYGMTAMFGILPPVMAFKMRARLAESAREARDMATDDAWRMMVARGGEIQGARRARLVCCLFALSLLVVLFN